MECPEMLHEISMEDDGSFPSMQRWRGLVKIAGTVDEKSVSPAIKKEEIQVHSAEG